MQLSNLPSCETAVEVGASIAFSFSDDWCSAKIDETRHKNLSISSSCRWWKLKFRQLGWRLMWGMRQYENRYRATCCYNLEAVSERYLIVSTGIWQIQAVTLFKFLHFRRGRRPRKSDPRALQFQPRICYACISGRGLSFYAAYSFFRSNERKYIYGMVVN